MDCGGGGHEKSTCITPNQIGKKKDSKKILQEKPKTGLQKNSPVLPTVDLPSFDKSLFQTTKNLLQSPL